MLPTYADFSHTPPHVSNVELEYHLVRARGDHVYLDNGGSVTLHFAVDAPEEIPEATLVVKALVSRLERHPGYAPMDIVVNGKTDRPVIEDWAIPGGGDLPQNNTFAVAAGLLRRGRNTLTVSSNERSTSHLWLYAVFLDSVYERDKSAKALLYSTTSDVGPSVYTTTRRLAGAEEWEDSAPLTLYLSVGESVRRVEQYSWRDQSGTETAISCNEREFVGSRRYADGSVYEYRGTVQRSLPRDSLSSGGMRRYLTRHNWGAGWHNGDDLMFLIQEHGGTALTSLSWRNITGGRGMVMFSPDNDSFAGTHQSGGEGPVAYQGRRR